MKKAQQGFTLIELMIVVAIIAILASMAMSAYQGYLIRAQVAEGLSLSGPLKRGVASFVNETGAFPTDNAEAALEVAGAYTGTYVNSISVAGAIISIEYGNDANAKISGETVTLTALNNLGSVSWTCATGGVISESYLPSACR